MLICFGIGTTGTLTIFPTAYTTKPVIATSGAGGYVQSVNIDAAVTTTGFVAICSDTSRQYNVGFYFISIGS